MYLVSTQRLERMRQILLTRQASLELFMDYVYSEHNLAAIVRSCDAVNIGKLYYRHQKKARLSNEITQGAHKWIFHEYVEDIVSFYQQKKQEGFEIVATILDEDTIDFREVDYTKPTLIVLGNEVEGVSEITKEFATKKVKIPMYGMSQSLNVSVAAAVMLYEAQRQRALKGMYNIPSLPKEIIEATLKKWAHDDIIEKWKKVSKNRAKSY